jgi:peptidoglycan/xylan/chitin deacetylase (PgdA/CDA1 family)
MRAVLKRWLLRVLVRPGVDGRRSCLPALAYHSIDESGSPVSFPLSHFRAQIEWLASHGYQALTAREAGAALAGRARIGERAVVLTFDDGLRSVSETALPVLAEFGFAATVFCAAGYVGKVCGWDRAPGIPEMDMMSWEDIRLLADQGWEIGGHSVSHAHLPALAEAARREEIAESRRILQDRTGCSVTSFAYPFGEFDQVSADAVAEAGFSSAWTMDPIGNLPGCDLFSLGRFNCDRIQSDSPDAAELAIRTYLSGRYGWYALLTARRLRIRRRARRKQ